MRINLTDISPLSELQRSCLRGVYRSRRRSGESPAVARMRIASILDILAHNQPPAWARRLVG